MPLELLSIHNARNLKEYSLTLHPHLNIIYGSNGAGKTTILESIYLLLRARTFRSNKFKSFINHDENTCTVYSKFSEIGEDFSNNFTLGISRSKDLSQPIIHLNSKKINSLASVTNLVVLGLITPESFNLLDSGPSIRRKFLDWGVFHVEPNFLFDWRSFKKIINSRNKLLSSYSKSFIQNNRISETQKDMIDCWAPQLVLLNNKLHQYRYNQINKVSVYFKKYLSKFSSTLSLDVSLNYYQGWTKGISYSEYLSANISSDLTSGFTRYGSHRSDIKITINKNLAKDILSRGQKKIIIICLIIAQFSYLIESDTKRNNLLLLDDIDSELDEHNLKILFDLLDHLKCQVFVTTTNKNKFDFIKKDLDYKLFHVEHNKI